MAVRSRTGCCGKLCWSSFVALFAIAIQIGLAPWLYVPPEDPNRYPDVLSLKPNLSGVSSEFVVLDSGAMLGVRTAGSRESSKGMVLLIHGFPETALSTWKHVLPHLGRLGYFAVAPDMRGYNMSFAGVGPDVNNGEQSSLDMRALVAHYKFDKATVVGHDWGGAVAWLVAMRHSQIVHKLVILDSPHPAAYRSFSEKNPSQILRSWYMLAFQIPWLPEWLCRQADFAFLRWLAFDTANPGSYSREDLAELRAAWRVDGGLTAMIDYYRFAIQRNLFDKLAQARLNRIVDAPTLIIWGENDVYLDPMLATESLKFAPHSQSRSTSLPGASHWITADSHETINVMLTTFLSEELLQS